MNCYFDIRQAFIAQQIERQNFQTLFPCTVLNWWGEWISIHLYSGYIFAGVANYTPVHQGMAPTDIWLLPLFFLFYIFFSHSHYRYNYGRMKGTNFGAESAPFEVTLLATLISTAKF